VSIPWSPIIPPDSAIACEARSALSAISVAIANSAYPPPVRSRRVHRRYEEPLLFGYLALAESEDLSWFRRTEASLNVAIESAPGLQSNLALYGGLCGLGWIAQHLATEFGDEDAPESETTTEIDLVVLRYLEQSVGQGPYDLISGLAGFGIYFLERLPARTAIDGLELVLRRIEERTQETAQGITWHSGPETLPEWQRDLCPSGYYNLGVAHGVPGILHLLSEICAAGVERARAARLLEGGMDWLLANQRPPGSISRFSAWIAPGQSHDSRLAWCYGDLGILAILLQVARGADRPDWLTFGLELLNHCLKWPPEETGIKDSALCHGATGVAHIFNRIYHLTGDPDCREAALTWLQRALAMRRPDEGVGGFLTYVKPEPGNQTIWEPNPAFLDGSIGIALALLSGLEPIEPAWDRLLLLSSRQHR
jgi:hypothetical protein